jgi:hypothetical protein
MSLTRRLILQKARHHPTRRRALTACRHTVSGTISLPSRGTFHHSLTVLIRYRSSEGIQAYRVVSADSQQISRARCYSGTLIKAGVGFSRTGLSPSTAGHPKTTSANHDTFSLPSRKVVLDKKVPQPRTHNPYPVSHAYGLAILRFRSPLLTESLLFSLPTGTEMFHFPALPPAPYVFRYG